ncbi:MAG: cytochrome c [Anaerolineales bacterium]
MKRALKITFLALVAAFALLAAGRGFSLAVGEVPGDAIHGGRIYDNWILALDTSPPEGNHPLWGQQDNNARSGVITWRCVECHGWDYKGADGAYGPYSNHYSGFGGVESVIGSSQEDVIDWLDGTNNPEHNFLTWTTATALNDLAAFLRTQQVNTDLIIDPATGEALGNRGDGMALYEAACASCHGDQGTEMNFGSTVAPLYLGDIAAADPWQALHKIRFGSPTSGRMPSSEEQDWSLSMVADVLAYMQVLPRGNPDYAILAPNPDQTGAVENQAQIEPIVWGTFVIIVVVGLNVAWDLYIKRQPI